ncbi:MAG TPA: metallophosphoesterase [Solirubrobacterales bacterium]
MRTAILSDLHLGAASGEDVLRDAATRRILLEEIADADEVILLGDVVELRDYAVGPALSAARPFFQELGEALGERRVTIVPGNHDHRFAEPLLDSLSLEGDGQLGLEHFGAPSPGPTATIDGWLGPASLRIAYPGLWVREDVYASHGHYMDAHLPVPRAECLATATLIRLSGQLPAAASAADYEKVLRPIYGFSYGVAQARPQRIARRRGKAAEIAWEVLAGERRGGSRRQQLNRAAIRNGFPAAVWAVNRLLHADFDPDVSSESIFRGGLAAAAELATRLGLDGVHVINGHTHRAGPFEGDAEWPLSGGGHLHNTGSWCFASAFHHPGTPPNPYWPGTVTWVEDEGAPRRVRLLIERSHAELIELIERPIG